jgi:hypothetical protein
LQQERVFDPRTKNFSVTAAVHTRSMKRRVANYPQPARNIRPTTPAPIREADRPGGFPSIHGPEGVDAPSRPAFRHPLSASVDANGKWRCGLPRGFPTRRRAQISVAETEPCDSPLRERTMARSRWHPRTRSPASLFLSVGDYSLNRLISGDTASRNFQKGLHIDPRFGQT